MSETFTYEAILAEAMAEPRTLVTVERAGPRAIVTLPPYTLEMTRPLLRAAVDAPWGQAMVMEEFAEANCFSTQVLPSVAATKRK